MPAQQAATEPVDSQGRRFSRRLAGCWKPVEDANRKTKSQLADQQPKVKTILQQLHDATQRIMQDKTVSRDQLLDKVRPLRMKANNQLREILSDDQKKKSINTCRARTRTCMAPWHQKCRQQNSKTKEITSRPATRQNTRSSPANPNVARR